MALPALQERIPLKNTAQRLCDLLILALLLSLLSSRLASRQARGPLWLASLACESWFTLVWLLSVNFRWSPVLFRTRPHLLSDRLPPVDLFVTSADPRLELPIVTANTVLSLLALDYPPRNLACYVSDDGASPLTYYSLVEASKFARLWVPFCKRYNVPLRAPFAYFAAAPQDSSSEFTKEWKRMKDGYEELCRRVEQASVNSVLLEDFLEIDCGNHPSIVKVIWENKEGLECDVPHLVYVAREKRPEHPHHYKAGAMNVLTRVSGVMTNAPFMLNVDCDVFANNPEVVLQAMCLLLGFEHEGSSAFVQSPQLYYGGLKDDPFGNQMVVLQQKAGKGQAGIQGPFYAGSGCFHRRKFIYGSPPYLGDGDQHDDLPLGELRRIYGNSKELVESVAQITSGKLKESQSCIDLTSRIVAAKQVAGCTYEHSTCWGKEIGWAYGSLVEDVLTGLRIHAMGWRSIYHTPDPPAFLGNAPTGGPAALTQHKRWATGLLEVLFCWNSPLLIAFTKKLTFRQCLSYLSLNVWALRSVFEFCYALLPAICLLANTSFVPKVSEPGFITCATLFFGYNIYTLMEYLQCGQSMRAWWNNQRMQRILALTAYLLSFFSVILKLLGLSETIFEVTKKDQTTNMDASNTGRDPGRFTFDSSPVFISGTFLVIVNLTAIGLSLLRLVKPVGSDSSRGPGLGEYVCSVWILLSFWPFVRGLFEKGSYGIPWPTICKALALVLVFLQLCRWGIIN